MCHIGKVFPMAQASIVIISVQRSMEQSLRLHLSLSHKASEAPSAQNVPKINIITYKQTNKQTNKAPEAPSAQCPKDITYLQSLEDA